MSRTLVSFSRRAPALLASRLVRFSSTEATPSPPQSFKTLLDALYTKTTKRVIETDVASGQLAQEILLRRSMGKKLTEEDRVLENNGRKRVIEARPASQKEVTALIKAIEHKSDIDGLVALIGRLGKQKRGYRTPDWQSALLFRHLVLKGFYPEATRLMNTPREHNFSRGPETRHELLRTYAIHLRLAEHSVSSTGTVARRFERYVNDPLYNGLAIASLGAIMHNTSYYIPAHLPIQHAAAVKKFTELLGGAVDEHPISTPVSSIKSFTNNQLIALERLLVDFELTHQGLVKTREVIDQSDAELLKLNSKLTSLFETKQRELREALAARAQFLGRANFTSWTLEKYEEALSRRAPASEEPEAEEAEA
ncbi:hypothetical protein BZA70DRAFT_276105 [Myxozyma melibiosi]|uniref:Uncharacterized protein n=1 Tax=Myxozyma melibiosi TaxID=54550 RepID=A0ABR1F8X1_9ASCO